MRYVLSLEAIGDNYYAYQRHMRRYPPTHFGWKEEQALKLGRRGMQPWVAKITGIDAAGAMQRRFVRGQKDYSDANGSGSRGVWFYYALQPGMYEVNQRLTWQRARRYFLEVLDAATARELTREEVIRCLQ